MKKPDNFSDIRSLIGSMNQFIRFIPKLAAATETFRDLMKKHSIFEWEGKHDEAFEMIKTIL